MFRINREWVRFITPQNQTMDENMVISKFKFEVSVVVSEEDTQQCENKVPNMDVDDIPTPPTSRSRASSD